MDILTWGLNFLSFILVIRLSAKPIVREVSQNWDTRISNTDVGSTVEIALLEARANRAYPLDIYVRGLRESWPQLLPYSCLGFINILRRPIVAMTI